MKTVWAGNADGIKKKKKAGLDFCAGLGTNIFNSVSAKAYKDLGAEKLLLSAELTLSQIKNMSLPYESGVYAYGRLPLMRTRNCPIKNKKTCAQCGKSSFLTDRKGITFPVVCSSGVSEILNSKPVYMADRLDEIKNAGFIMLYFTTETKREAAEIISAYRSGKSPTGEFTRGLLYRGVE